MTRREIFSGRVGRYGLEDVVLPNGVPVTLEVLRHPGACAVVPLHADGTVTLVRQHRHCAGGLLWELPAGKLEPGEAPETCAARELAEEAGLAGDLRFLTTIWTAPAYTDERIHLYVATALREVPMGLDPDEVLHPVRMSLAEARARIAAGEITDAKTICGLALV